jgi:hypothetical protein
MLDKNDVKSAIVIPIILGVVLAILYDVLQEFWKWSFSQSISNNTLLVDVYSKIPAGTITILVGLLMILWAYRKYLK